MQPNSLNFVLADEEQYVELQDKISSSFSVEDEVIGRSLVSDISKLSSRKQAVAKLKHAGYSQMEIARAVGVSQAQVSRELVELKRVVNQ